MHLNSESTAGTICVAILASDNFPEAASRTRGNAESRQFVLRAEEFDVHVKILGRSDSRELLGQLFPRKAAGLTSAVRLHLLRNGERLETTAADSMGEFHFADVPDGLLSLQVDLPHLTVIGSLNVLNFGSDNI